jgi:chlorobactene glucosyltransferase
MVVFLIVVLSIHIAILSTSIIFLSRERIPTARSIPLVSVLIPARNEEQTISDSISCAFSQSYPNIEVVTYNDQSSDSTREKMEALSQHFSSLRILEGGPVPEGWIGKSWACHNLAVNAKGEILLFVDADVVLGPHGVQKLVDLHYRYKKAVVSLFPRQVCISHGERLLVPLMDLLVFSILPYPYLRRTNSPRACAANGQCLLISSDSYKNSGGHLAVRHHVVEDMALARRCILSGTSVVTRWGDDMAQCRMYHSFKESLRGFQKNIFASFKNSLVPFFCVTMYLTTLFTLPLVLALYSGVWLPLFLLLLLRSIHAFYFGYSALVILYHPVAAVCFLYLSISSIIKTKYGLLTWKERAL